MAGPATAAQRRDVLLAAALASPHPDAQDAGSHPTDVAVIAGAEREGLGTEIRVRRRVEVPFDPARSFHATVVDGQFVVKGAAEALVERCVAVRRDGRRLALTERERQALLDQAERLARRGLRVLMVADGRPRRRPGRGSPRPGGAGLGRDLRPAASGWPRPCAAAGRPACA